MSRKVIVEKRVFRQGEVIRGRSMKFSLARVLAFSGGLLGESDWPHGNIHTDGKIARAAGLPDIIVSGTQFEGLLLSHLVRLFGSAWHISGELEAKFVQSVYLDDVVTPVAMVQAVDPHGTGARLRLDVWCEKEGEEKVLVGTATVQTAQVH